MTETMLIIGIAMDCKQRKDERDDNILSWDFGPNIQYSRVV